MWFIFGLTSIIATLVNLYLFSKSKDYKLAMAIAIATTALTVLSLYSKVSDLLIAEDWSSLLDTVPTTSLFLNFLVSASILLNITPTILDLLRKNK